MVAQPISSFSGCQETSQYVPMSVLLVNMVTLGFLGSVKVSLRDIDTWRSEALGIEIVAKFEIDMGLLFLLSFDHVSREWVEAYGLLVGVEKLFVRSLSLIPCKNPSELRFLYEASDLLPSCLYLRFTGNVLFLPSRGRGVPPFVM